MALPDIEVRCIDVLEGPVAALGRFLGQAETHKVGVSMRWMPLSRSHRALNFSIAHDDGQSLDSIDGAEVILTAPAGPPRRDRVYLAIRGIAPPIALVPGMRRRQTPGSQGPLIVGLWVSRTGWYRSAQRLTSMGENRDSNYIELDAVRAEMLPPASCLKNRIGR